jgi:hypothetical protein
MFVGEVTGTWEPRLNVQARFKLHLHRFFNLLAQVPVTLSATMMKSWPTGGPGCQLAIT